MESALAKTLCKTCILAQRLIFVVNGRDSDLEQNVHSGSEKANFKTRRWVRVESINFSRRNAKCLFTISIREHRLIKLVDLCKDLCVDSCGMLPTPSTSHV